MRTFKLVNIVNIVAISFLAGGALARPFTAEEAELATKYETLKREIISLENEKMKTKLAFNSTVKLEEALSRYSNQRKHNLPRLKSLTNKFSQYGENLANYMIEDSATLDSVRSWTQSVYKDLIQSSKLDDGVRALHEFKENKMNYMMKCDELATMATMSKLSDIKKEISIIWTQQRALSYPILSNQVVSSDLKISIEKDVSFFKEASDLVNAKYSGMKKDIQYPKVCNDINKLEDDTRIVMSYLKIIDNLDTQIDDSKEISRSIYSFIQSTENRLSRIESRREISLYLNTLQGKYRDTVTKGDLLNANSIVNNLAHLINIAKTRINNDFKDRNTIIELMNEVNTIDESIRLEHRSLEGNIEKLNTLAYRWSRTISTRNRSNFVSGKTPLNLVQEAEKYGLDLRRARTLFEASSYDEILEYFRFLKKLEESI